MKGDRYNFGAVGYAFGIAETTELKPHEFAILVTLAGHYDDKKRTAYPSIDRLVNITGISRASVHRAIKGLTERDLIRVEKNRGEGKRYTHNEYRFPGYTPSAEKRSGTFGSTARFETSGTGSAPQTAGYFT